MDQEFQMAPDERETLCGCGAMIRYTPMLVAGREMFTPTICELCSQRREADMARNRTELGLQLLNGRWLDVCPPLYQETTLARLPAHFVTTIETWSLRGVAPAFVGTAGQGKTRAAFEILKRQHFAGVWVEAISSTRFAKMAADQFDDDRDARSKARSVLSDIHKCRLLLLDDLGKQRMSERAELELYDLLEHRTSNMLPTIWTANASGDDLLAMFSKDRGEPILRRLAEFSEIPSRKAKAA